ncbi:Hypothetical_protein [Hexamita inflata]|uniref:Hypothetical_protein n=1 Tax=Hexamita inflata TaxID=28002 RepID=A0AA86PYM8_9EUKA|nr:Hypothetical protein HINF_LOCUS35368 [Hexamita inflata]
MSNFGIQLSWKDCFTQTDTSIPFFRSLRFFRNVSNFEFENVMPCTRLFSLFQLVECVCQPLDKYFCKCSCGIQEMVRPPQLFSAQRGWSKIESIVGLLQFLQIMLIPDTQDSRQNGFHIPHVVLKYEVKKQRKNEQISNFDFQIMLQINKLSLKSSGGYYSIPYTNLSMKVFKQQYQKH